MEQIKRKDLWEYEKFVCIELLNYLNSSFYQEIEYEESTLESFDQYCERIFEYEETQHAIEIVENENNYRNKHVELIIEQDIQGLEKYEREVLQQNGKKNIIKKYYTGLYKSLRKRI